MRMGYKVKVLALSVLWAATLISAAAFALSPRDHDPQMALLFIAMFIATEAITLACRGELLKRLSNTRREMWPLGEEKAPSEEGR